MRSLHDGSLIPQLGSLAGVLCLQANKLQPSPNLPQLAHCAAAICTSLETSREVAYSVQLFQAIRNSALAVDCMYSILQLCPGVCLKVCWQLWLGCIAHWLVEHAVDCICTMDDRSRASCPSRELCVQRPCPAADRGSVRFSGCRAEWCRTAKLRFGTDDLDGQGSSEPSSNSVQLYIRTYNSSTCTTAEGCMCVLCRRPLV